MMWDAWPETGFASMLKHLWARAGFCKSGIRFIGDLRSFPAPSDHGLQPGNPAFGVSNQPIGVVKHLARYTISRCDVRLAE